MNPLTFAEYPYYTLVMLASSVPNPLAPLPKPAVPVGPMDPSLAELHAESKDQPIPRIEQERAFQREMQAAYPTELQDFDRFGFLISFHTQEAKEETFDVHRYLSTETFRSFFALPPITVVLSYHMKEGEISLVCLDNVDYEESLHPKELQEGVQRICADPQTRVRVLHIALMILQEALRDLSVYKSFPRATSMIFHGPQNKAPRSTRFPPNVRIEDPQMVQVHQTCLTNLYHLLGEMSK